MPRASIFKTTIFEDTGCINMARIVENAAALILQATITGITVTVIDLSDKSIVTGPDALVVADVVFDALQTDAIWQDHVTGIAIDATGYNFKHTAPETYFPNGNRTYRIEYLFDPVTGTNFMVPFEIKSSDRFGD